MKFVSTRGGSRAGHPQRRDPRRHRPGRRIVRAGAPAGGLAARLPRSALAAGDRRVADRAVRRRRSDRGGARRDLRVRRSTSPPRSCRSSARAAGPACSSSFTARPARSRISAPASWRRPWRASHRPRDRQITILVATSGDTGGAVAAAFHRRPSIDVVLLYPRGSCRRARRSSSPAGATTCGPSRSAARSTTASAWSRRRSGIPRSRPPTSSPRRTASTSDGSCRRWCTTRRRASRSGIAKGGARTSSCRPAISAT